MASAREKLELKIMEFQTERIPKEKSTTIDDLNEYLQNNAEIDIKKENDTTGILTIDGYSFKINENLEIVEELGILTANTEVTYVVNSTGENIENITITITNKTGIAKVVTPEGLEIFPTEEKTKISIDYEMIKGQEYIFKIQKEGKSELEEFILKDDTVEINQTESYLYPTLYDTGVETNKYITINYGENTNNYYSIDNGETWIKYTGNIKIDKELTILAKSMDRNKINKISKQEIKFELASNALPYIAYDGNMSTRVEGDDETEIIYIDKSMWEKNVLLYIYTHDNHGRVSIYLYNENGELLSSTSNNTPSNKKWWKTVTIPTNTKEMRIVLQNPNAKLYEIQPENLK